MKKLIALFGLTFALLCAATNADAQVYYNGKNAKFTFPRGIDSNKVYTFPTYKYREQLSWDDTLAVSVTDLETYFSADSIANTSLVNISRNAYVYPGAKLYLKLSSTATDSIRTITVKDGSTIVDTLYVGRLTYANYFYNGYTFQKVSNGPKLNYLGTVTQASSITTGVTLNADAGVITTVASTLAIDSSASFTVTNSFAKTTSAILLSIEYSGNGQPTAVITSRSDGSFALKIKNSGNAALTAAMKIHFLIRND